MLKWIQRWWPAAVILLGVLLGSGGQYASRVTSGTPSKVWFALSVAGALIAALTTVVERIVKGKRDLAGQERQRVAYNDVLDPLVQSLSRVITPDEHERARATGVFREQVLTAASKLSGKPGARVRASYFQGRTNDGKTEWRSVNSTGRAGAPTTVFKQGETAGDSVFDMVRQGVPRVCVDVSTDPPPGWDASRSASYGSFIAVPARVNVPGSRRALAYGFLSVDGPEAKDLSHGDVPLLSVLATLLAVSELLEATLKIDALPEQS